MEITVSQAEGKVSVTVMQTHGALDASTYEQLIEEARQLYDAGARDLIIDLSDTPLMSSAGLVALHTIALMLRGEALPDAESGWESFRAIDRYREGGVQDHLKLLNPNPHVDKSLEMVGFKNFIEVYGDLDEAVASFG